MEKGNQGEDEDNSDESQTSITDIANPITNDDNNIVEEVANLEQYCQESVEPITASEEPSDNSKEDEEVVDPALGHDISNNSQQETGEEGAPNTTQQMMENIFGNDDDLSDDDEQGIKEIQKSDDNDESSNARAQVIAGGSDDEEDEFQFPGGRSDFDQMMLKKREERRRARRIKRDASFDLISDADDAIKALIDMMNEAANEDRLSNVERRPAIRKLLMLPRVRATLIRSDLFNALLENGMISALSEWLAPLPDKSLPALEIRTTLLNILESFPMLDQTILKQSGIGKAVMFLYKHPKEIKQNRLKASRLIREWSRPIFQLDQEMGSMTREERIQRDFMQMPEAKRSRIRVDSEGLPMSTSSAAHQDDNSDEESGDDAVLKEIPRARVPKPSTKDYVIRPRPEIEGSFRGQSQKSLSKFDRKLKEFRDNKRRRPSLHAVTVSLEGRNA